MLENPVVEIAQGYLRGVQEGAVNKFLGIPYAAPPIGELRWKAPASPPNWPGVRDASSFGSCAIQYKGAIFDLRTKHQSEDCLYLNVWTASVVSTNRRPVMVWIHGGGYLGGAGSEDAYDGASFAQQGIVLITINYRLGAFGFLSHPTVGANFAVQDCVAALEWVRRNVAAFGGDPSNVTIFGQSAGAVLARMLLASRLADGLFHKVIMESGSGERAAFAPELSWDHVRQTAERLFERVGTSEPEELRQIPSDVIGQVSDELCGIPPPPGRIHTPAHLVWAPFADGNVVVKGVDPLQPRDIPILMGCTQNEARYFLKPGSAYPPATLSGMIALLGGPCREEIARILSSTHDGVYESIDQLFTAAIFTEPAFETARQLTRSGKRVYYYEFSRVAPGAASSQELAKHTAEIRYVFNNLTDDGYYDEVDRRVADRMHSAWRAFAQDGVPKTDSSEPWPEFLLGAPQMVSVHRTIDKRPYVTSELVRAINSMRMPPKN